MDLAAAAAGDRVTRMSRSRAGRSSWRTWAGATSSYADCTTPLPPGASRRVSPTHGTRSHYMCQSPGHGPDCLFRVDGGAWRRGPAPRASRRRRNRRLRASASFLEASDRTDPTLPARSGPTRPEGGVRPTRPDPPDRARACQKEAADRTYPSLGQSGHQISTSAPPPLSRTQTRRRSLPCCNSCPRRHRSGLM